MNGILFLILFLKLTVAFSDENVDFYMRTIQEGIAKARAFVAPENSLAYMPTSTNLKDFERIFDYIVIGAGSAGSVIAARLSENPSTSVLVLEAGKRESTFGQVPAMTPFLQSGEFVWPYRTTPQTTSCLAMTNSRCAYPRGKALGGTSAINGLIYARGNKKDFDNWEKMNCHGWSYADVLPIFKKMENADFSGDIGYHGTGGKLNVEFHHPDSPQVIAFLEANLQTGAPILDYNGQNQLGASKTQFNYKNGTRQSSSTAFLSSALSRENLLVMTESYVTKILIKRTLGIRAYGAVFAHNNQLYKARARREVILSAGVIGSPQILMLSGIGPRSHLNSLGIPVIQNLPVGSNFQDHPVYPALFFSTNYTEPDRGMEAYVKEYLDGYGPYTIAANLQGIGFYKTEKNKNTNSKNPDFELLLQASNSTSLFVQKIHYYNDVAIDTIWRKVDPQSFFAILCLVLHPKSKGTVRLNSTNPYDYPLIDTNLLSDLDGEDIETLYEAIQTALKLVDTESFKKINATLAHLPLPQCIAKHTYLSKDYWYCQLRQLSWHLYHGSGTCRMGNCPTTSVVNPDLKVHGVLGLRVADTSIFPTPIAGHNNAAAMMVGEKAAQLIQKTR